MIIRFSIQGKEGNELFAHETDNEQLTMIGMDLIRGFMNSSQMTSVEDPNLFQYVIFYNTILYMKDYEKFNLRLIVNQILDDQELNTHFDNLYKEINEIINTFPDNFTYSELPPINTFIQNIDSILTPITEDFIFDKDRLQELDRTKIATKVALVGLANAGKTSLKRLFFDNWSKEMIRKIRATIGLDISRRYQEFIEHHFIIMDFGGQEVYRKEHLEKDKIWSEISSLIFVIDIQDQNSFNSAKMYLDEVWKIVSQVNKRVPKLLIFFHKYDTTLRKDLQDNLKLAMEIFRDYNTYTSFSLTTIEDSSSQLALVKAFSLSLPEIILPKLITTKFYDYFKTGVLTKFSLSFKSKDESQITQVEEQKWEKWAEVLGFSCGLAFQKTWFHYLTGKRTMVPFSNAVESLEIMQKDDSLFIKVPSNQFEEDTWKPLFNGFLRGLLKSFHLPPAQMIKESSLFVEWKVNL